MSTNPDDLAERWRKRAAALRARADALRSSPEQEGLMRKLLAKAQGIETCADEVDEVWSYIESP